MQKMGFIPEAQNDMIFSIICEELGLFGAIAVIMMFVLLIWRLMIIANNAPDLFGALLVVGVMGHISIQVILNIAVVTNVDFPIPVSRFVLSVTVVPPYCCSWQKSEWYSMLPEAFL